MRIWFTWISDASSIVRNVTHLHLPHVFVVFLLTVFVCLFFPFSSHAQHRLFDLDLQGPIQGPVKIEAGMLVSRNSGEHIFLSDRVTLTAHELHIESDWLELWPKQHRAVFGGGVRVIKNRLVLLGDRLELDRNETKALVRSALFLVKNKPLIADGRRQCRTAGGLIRKGVNQLYLQGHDWVMENGKYRLKQASFTLCHCPADEQPSWELRAESADVVPDERAWLLAPVLALKGLGVIALPVWYIPLSSRKTGLLMPQVSYSGRDGFMVSQSLFITLGQHADSTVSLDWIEDRGFRQRLEFRLIPVRSSWFSLRLSHLSDSKAGREFGLSQRYSGELNGFVDFSQNLALRTRLRLFSDSSINRDFMSDLAGRAADYASSTVSLSWSGWYGHLAADVIWRQDLRISGVNLFGSADHAQLDRWGMDPVGDTIQRLGAVTWNLLSVHLFQGARFQMQLELANLSSVQAAWRDWGMDGTPNQREPKYEGAPTGALDDRTQDDFPVGTEANGTYDSGELRRAVRLRVEPQLEWYRDFGSIARLTVHLSHRQLVYVPHGPGAPAVMTRGISFASLVLDSELYRVWGTGSSALGHLLRPRLALAGAWQGLKSRDQLPYLDLQDRLMSDAAQLLVGLDSVVFARQNSVMARQVLRFWLDQTVDLKAYRIAQLVGGMELNVSPVSLRVRSGWDWKMLELVELESSIRLYDRRGDYFRLSYLYLPSLEQASGLSLPVSERTQREPGLLFGLLPEAYRGMGDGLHVIGFNAGMNVVAGISVSASVLVNIYGRTLDTYGGGLAYKSDCGCWGLSASFRMLRGQDYPDVFFLLDLGPLGSAGGSTASKF